MTVVVNTMCSKRWLHGLWMSRPALVPVTVAGMCHEALAVVLLLTSQVTELNGQKQPRYSCQVLQNDILVNGASSYDTRQQLNLFGSYKLT